MFMAWTSSHSNKLFNFLFLILGIYTTKGINSIIIITIKTTTTTIIIISITVNHNEGYPQETFIRPE